MNTENILDTLLQTEEDQILEIPLVELNLSKRVHSRLFRRGVETIGDLAQGWAAIRSSRHMDEKAYWELSKALYFWYFGTIQSHPSMVLPTKPEEEDRRQNAFDHPDGSNSPIEALELPLRIYYLLKENKINTIGDIYQQWDKLTSLKRVGPATLVQIQKALDVCKGSNHAHRRNHTSVPDRARKVSELPSHENVRRKDRLPEQPVATYSEEIKKIHIEALALPTRVYNRLKHNHIDTVGQILAKRDRIGSLPGIGSTSAEQVYKAIRDLQLAVGSAEERLGAADEVASRGGSCIRKSIYHLKLFDRTYPLLIHNGIDTIDQITATKLEELKSRGVLYTALIWDIQRGIHAWLNHHETLKNKYFESMREEAIRTIPEGSNFEEHFYNLLQEFLTPVQIAVIENRYGLKTGKGMTLVKTAAVCEVTSARVRQIESSALTTLQYPFALSELRQSLLILTMRQVIEDHGGLVAEPRLFQELQEQLRFQSYSMGGVVRFIRKMFDGEIRIVGSDIELIYINGLEAWSAGPWDPERILQASLGILEILSTSPSPLHWSDMYAMLMQEAGLMNLDENIAHAIAMCLRDHEIIDHEMDGKWSKTRDLRSRQLSVKSKTLTEQDIGSLKVVEQ